MTADRDRSLDNLISSLTQSGAEINDVVVRNVEGNHLPLLQPNVGAGRGLFATRDIDQGETLIRIPEECFIVYGVLDSKFPE